MNLAGMCTCRLRRRSQIPSPLSTHQRGIATPRDTPNDGHRIAGRSRPPKGAQPGGRISRGQQWAGNGNDAKGRNIFGRGNDSRTKRMDAAWKADTLISRTRGTKRSVGEVTETCGKITMDKVSHPGSSPRLPSLLSNLKRGVDPTPIVGTAGFATGQPSLQASIRFSAEARTP